MGAKMDVLKYLEDFVPKWFIFILAIVIGGSWWVYSIEGRLATAAEKATETKTNYTVIVTKLEDFKKEVQLHNEQDIAFKAKMETKMEAITANQEKVLDLLKAEVKYRKSK